jgi:hypothetical protein
MQIRSENRALLIGLLALLLLLLAGGGLFLLLNTTPQQGSGPGPSGPNTTPVAQATQSGPVKAEPGDTVVTLTWELVGGATGYFVHRDGGREPLNVKPVAETRYMDIGLTNGRVYTYTVAPVIGGVERSSLPPVQVAPAGN